jgi:ribulose kinase
VATYLAGVDIGTSGAKAMVFDLAGNPLASAYQEYPFTYPRPGWVEQDADHLVEATMDAMARAVVQSGVKRLLSTQNCEQHFTPTANLMIRIKISRIHLTNSPEYERLRHRSLLFRTRLIFVAYPGGTGHEGIRFQRAY